MPGVLAQWRSSDDSTSISQRGHLMALERINVLKSFISENSIDIGLQRMALANSYVLASRLVFFDSSIPGRTYMLKAFKIRRSWPSEAKLFVVLYILFLPYSQKFNKIILKFLAWAK
jgi:hypothetical protein